MADFATCVFKTACSNPLNMVSTVCPLGAIWINQLTTGANCGNVRGENQAGSLQRPNATSSLLQSIMAAFLVAAMYAIQGQAHILHSI